MNFYKAYWSIYDQNWVFLFYEKDLIEIKPQEESTINTTMVNTQEAICNQDSVEESREGWMDGIKWIEKPKLHQIKTMCDTMVSEGKLVFEYRNWLGPFATFVDLPDMPQNNKWENRFWFYDASKYMTGTSEYYSKTDYKKSRSTWVDFERNNVTLKAMRGTDPESRVDSPVKTLVQERKKSHKIGLCRKAKMKKMLWAIG